MADDRHRSQASGVEIAMVRCILLCSLTVAGLSAEEFSLQIVDGLNRALAGVEIEVACLSPDHKTEREMHLTSGHDGTAHGSYDDSLCKPESVSVEKPGYSSYFTGFLPRYVMRRKVDVLELELAAKLEGAGQITALREVLAGKCDAISQFRDAALYYETQLRPALRALARDPLVTERARDLLATIGVFEDLQLIMRLAPPPGLSGLEERWRYAVATALVNPDNEEEWAFLRRCALNEFEDRWVDAAAIQALKLTASTRSQAILEEARKKNRVRTASIGRALDYIKSNPAPLADANLDTLAKRVADAIKIGDWEGNGEPRFNQAGDKALLDFTFQTAEDRLVYTATFHRVDGVWIFRGAHETDQAFAPRFGVTPKR